MIAFDTNYLVRHLIHDDPKQCAEVTSVVLRESEKGRRIMLFDIVLCETLWVLESAYGATRKDLPTALYALNAEPAFAFEHPERVYAAIRRFERGNADFSDYMILETGREKGQKLKTFDKKTEDRSRVRGVNRSIDVRRPPR